MPNDATREAVHRCRMAAVDALKARNSVEKYWMLPDRTEAASHDFALEMIAYLSEFASATDRIEDVRAELADLKGVLNGSCVL